MTKALLVGLTILFVVPNFIDIPVFPKNAYDQKEEYDPALSVFNSVDKLSGHIDSILASKKLDSRSYESVMEISNTVKRRFYHGYSHFSSRQNWIAVISGKLLDSGMACKVHPDDILGHPNAACSQQAIVMMALLRKKGIAYRHLAFPHHYALEVSIAGTWYFFDPNMEPSMNKEQRSDAQWQYRSDRLKRYYVKKEPARMDYAFGYGLTAQRGVINEIPAPNARLFQSATGILSKTLWCFPLMILAFRPRKKKVIAAPAPVIKYSMTIAQELSSVQC